MTSSELALRNSELSERVAKRQPLAAISDPMGEREYLIRSPGDGYVIGGISVKGFSLGPVAGVLFAGIFFGHEGLRITPGAQAVGFALFIFSVGYQAGPRFFSALKADGLKYFVLSLVVALAVFAPNAYAAYLLELSNQFHPDRLGKLLRQLRIDRDEWDAMAKPLPTPFLEWDWLRLMETSGSATAKTGWLPHHLTVWSGENLAAVAPMYVKGHSAGEFVFDHVWADIAGRMGIKYYPKLVGMSPFTPMSGYRFLIADGENELELTAFMVAEIDRLCHRYNISGSSFLFVDPQWNRDMLKYGYSGWRHQSYAWKNQGYKSFDDYLSVFNSNQRRNIKRERNALKNQGVFIKTFTGGIIQRCAPEFILSNVFGDEKLRMSAGYQQ